MTSTTLRNLFLALSVAVFLPSGVSAANSLTVTEPYFARHDGISWRSFDPEIAPPLRGEYIRIGLRYVTTQTVSGVERSHSVRNSNGEEYDFDVSFRGVTKTAGNHITFVSYKVPGDAPDHLDYQGTIGANGIDATTVDLSFPVVGATVPLHLDIHHMWIAEEGGSIYEEIDRPVRPGEIVRLAVEFYTERSHDEGDDHLDVMFDIEDMDFQPVAFARRVDGAGYHVSYRYVMIPTTEIGGYSPDAPWMTTFSATISRHADIDYGNTADGMLYTEPGQVGNIADPPPPALYITKTTPSDFLNPNNEDHVTEWNLESDKSLKPGDTFYAYIVWEEDGHQLPADMVLETSFEIPELGETKSREKQWRLRGGYSFRQFTIPADSDLTSISFRGALDLVGGSKGIVYGEEINIEVESALRNNKDARKCRYSNKRKMKKSFWHVLSAWLKRLGLM